MPSGAPASASKRFVLAQVQHRDAESPARLGSPADVEELLDDVRTRHGDHLVGVLSGHDRVERLDRVVVATWARKQVLPKGLGL